MSQTIKELIASHDDSAAAIGAPGRDWLTYGGLRALAGSVATSLNEAGVGRGDRVAIVLPNGPEMAAAFVTVAQTAVTAPLNPAYRQEEFEFYLEDLGAKAIVLMAGDEGPAAQAAKKLNLAIVRVTVDDTEPAGSFELSSDVSGSGDPSAPEAGDVALILHTSGTTSRPKIVPLMQSNVTASAGNIAASLALTSEDRCLNVMPLFHIHGLIAAVLSTLGSGGQVWCAPGFDALRFFGWLKDAKPTWYTAVPTMHQTILARAGRNAEIIENAKLRFLRSSSASLPGPVMTKLNETFGAPVIEGYGMTESSPVASVNPIDGSGKIGTIGLPLPSTEMRIVDDGGAAIGVGEIGEIQIRGPQVMKGYFNRPEETAKTITTEGWLCTGDIGKMHEDGYFQIVDRKKDMILVSGFNVYPNEVEDVVAAHPKVLEVAAIGIPDEKSGEVVKICVVKKDDSLTAEELKAFCQENLTGYKRPRQIEFREDLPKTNVGKILRRALREEHAGK